jgi:phage baseplate assembly protein W
VVVSPNGFLGLRLPLNWSEGRGISSCWHEEEHIHQSILMILSTRPGTRPLEPEFGCRVHELLFRPLTATLQGQMSFFITQALERWESRISVLGVSADLGPATDEVFLTVRYRLRTERTPGAETERQLVLGIANGILRTSGSLPGLGDTSNRGSLISGSQP